MATATTPHRRAMHQAQQSPRTYVTTAIDASHPTGLTPPQSLSANVPFDWEAARNLNQRPPYDPRTPERRRPGSASALGRSDSGDSEMRKKQRVKKQESWFQWLKNYPSQILFDISMIPHNLPLPESKTIGRAAGAAAHVLTFLTAYLTDSGKSEFDAFGDGWSDMNHEISQGIPDPFAEPENGWHIAWILSWLLFLASIANAVYVFTRFRIYHLNMRTNKNPIKSPNARFVQRSKVVPGQQSTRSTLYHFLCIFGSTVMSGLRWLWGSKKAAEQPENAGEMVQALAIWYPDDMELALLSIYSPVHAMLWSMCNRKYWIRCFIIFGVLTLLMDRLIFFYSQLVKDTKALDAEVMFEYNEGFVYPKLNVIRKDACIQTSEAEIIDVRPPRQSMAAPRESLTSRGVVLGQGKTYQQKQQERMQDGSPRGVRGRHTVAGITPDGLLRV